jgi:hypothetical protein
VDFGTPNCPGLTSEYWGERMGAWGTRVPALGEGMWTSQVLRPGAPEEGSYLAGAFLAPRPQPRTDLGTEP